MTKKAYKVNGMNCTSCAMAIEGELEDCGAQRAKCSYASETLEVEFDENKINETKLKQVLNQLSYKLSPLTN